LKATDDSHQSYRLETTTSSSSNTLTPSLVTCVTPAESISLEEENAKKKFLKVMNEVCGLTEDEMDARKSLNELGIDSLMLIELASALRKTFNNRAVDDMNLESCSTLSNLENAVISMSAKAQASNDHSLIARASDLVMSTMGNRDQLPTGNKTRTSGEGHGARVRKVLRNLCGVDSQLHRDSTLESLGIDSLLFIELQRDLRKTLGLNIPEEKIRNCETVGDLEDLDVKPRENHDESGHQELCHLKDALNMHSLPASIQKADTQKAPLFLFHDGSGLVNMYSRLHDLGRRVYGFFNAGFFDVRENPSSLDEMVERYTSRFDATSTPEVVLGGTCIFFTNSFCILSPVLVMTTNIS
jgi:acyl carrier protein